MQEVKGESQVTTRLNKFKEKVLGKKKKSLEAASKKFSSNGSLLSGGQSQHGVKAAISETDMAGKLTAPGTVLKLCVYCTSWSP